MTKFDEQRAYSTGEVFVPGRHSVISDTLHKKHAKRLIGDGMYDIHGPVARFLVRAYAPEAETMPQLREGIGFQGKQVIRFEVLALWAYHTEVPLMNIIEQLEGNYDSAAKLWEGYKSRLDEFRSAVKNDVISLEASARKSTDATQRMRAAYSNVIDLLNSEQMTRAIENAERLAAAMTALAGLQTHKLVFSVTEQNRPGQ